MLFAAGAFRKQIPLAVDYTAKKKREKKRGKKERR
jgi:hypothetical protein